MLPMQHRLGLFGSGITLSAKEKKIGARKYVLPSTPQTGRRPCDARTPGIIPLENSRQSFAVFGKQASWPKRN